MAAMHGTGTVVIRRSHHIACLAAYLIRAAERGLVAIIESSDPLVAAVVPHGGLTPIITPNPIAAGLPTSGDPILVDVSMSITSMGFANQELQAGRMLPGPWLIDAAGNATADPAPLFNEPKGALLPLGGLDAGYKGFGLGLVVEALTAGLAGHGRADPPVGWGGTVFVQVLDPAAFGGLDAFRRQMDHVARRGPRFEAAPWRRSRAPPRRGWIEAAARAIGKGRRALPGDHAGARTVGDKARGRAAADPSLTRTQVALSARVLRRREKCPRGRGR